ncbi:Tetratricopeptide repeat protein 29 [Temnothorax longispinosus]|uniref:Tetratricopeptide repeat protein 29 n=1 Tax=Temnothorax longispinosus TaxID=300112 RepID=A0A4S2LAW3_9HYME|nr:Tetratricopeptide repeat protein 29 [Temnothorax longispinosus]
MRRARETRDRLTHVRGHDLGTLSKGPVRKDFSGELKEVGPKIGEGAMIKTLAAARTGEMEKIKDELRAMLPILKPSEVKRFRLPLHEAIVDELEEGNYEESVRYLKELFELDEAIRREAGPGTLTWEKPRLKNTRDAMLRLKESLIAVERAKNAGDYVSMAAEFLNTALYFQAMTWEWWWVTERLYRSALENAKLIEGDDERMSTFAHYLYGRFLFEQMQDTVQSLYHLKVAREASQEKSWNASKMTGRKEETIFRECNVLLYKALLMYAQQVGPDQPDVAVKAYTEALARATDSGHYENSANVLYELGMSQLRSGDVKLAYRNFSKFLAMAKRISDPEGICNAHMAMALAYKLRV